MRTRQELANLTDTELLVAFDACALRLRRAWSKGEAGTVTDAMEVGLMQVEAALRQLRLAPVAPFDQLRLFDPVPYGHTG